MQIAVNDAEGHLADLVRRARNGEELVLTLEGEPAVRLVPLPIRMDPVIRGAILDEICAAAAAKALPGPSAARSQDFLYDEETGLAT